MGGSFHFDFPAWLRSKNTTRTLRPTERSHLCVMPAVLQGPERRCPEHAEFLDNLRNPSGTEGCLGLRDIQEDVKEKLQKSSIILYSRYIEQPQLAVSRLKKLLIRSPTFPAKSLPSVCNPLKETTCIHV